MKVVKKWLIIAVAFFIVFFSGAGISYSTRQASYSKMIRIAFMNGYLEALKQNPARLEELKKDKNKMKNEITRAADAYIDKVWNLNKRQ